MPNGVVWEDLRYPVLVVVICTGRIWALMLGPASVNLDTDLLWLVLKTGCYYRPATNWYRKSSAGLIANHV